MRAPRPYLTDYRAYLTAAFRARFTETHPRSLSTGFLALNGAGYQADIWGARCSSLRRYARLRLAIPWFCAGGWVSHVEAHSIKDTRCHKVKPSISGGSIFLLGRCPPSRANRSNEAAAAAKFGRFIAPGRPRARESLGPAHLARGEAPGRKYPTDPLRSDPAVTGRLNFISAKGLVVVGWWGWGGWGG